MHFLFLALFLPPAFGTAGDFPCVEKLKALLKEQPEYAKRYKHCAKTMNGKDETIEGEMVYLYPAKAEAEYDSLTVNLGGTDFGGPLALASTPNTSVSCAEDGSVISEIHGLYRYTLKAEEKNLAVNYRNLNANPNYQLEFEANCQP